jgi:hypothetical protein
MALEIQEGPRTQELARALVDPISFATTLIAIFHDRFFDPDVDPAENCYTWHPETIAEEIRDEFRVELPRPNFDRLMVGLWLITSDEFYANLPSFVAACNVLSGGVFDPGYFDRADAAECAWGITEALLLGPPEEENEAPFSEEILGYIGMELAEEGIIHPPDVLRLGVGPVDLAGKITAEFSDDPELYAAILRGDAEKTREINALVRSGLTALTQQLGRLRLRHGDAADLAARLSRS